MRPRRIVFLVLLLAAAAALTAVVLPRGGHAAAAGAPGTITVNGTGSVTTVPDRASFGFTVETRAPTAAAALAQNGTETRKVIAAVKAADVADEDVQTAQVSLSPQTSDDGRTVVGYVASNSITVKVRDLARAGRIVDAAVNAGATGVSGPSLFRSDQDALYRGALKSAVAQARSKAEALAEAAAVTLGRPRSIVEGGGSVPLPLGIDKQSAPGTPIEPGTLQIEATVTVVYAAS